MSATTAAGQSAQTPALSERPPLVYQLDAETLADLPIGENVYAALENTQAEVIADRFNSGGLNVGEGVRLGGFLGSWSQTLFRIGEIDVSDPAGSGASLLFPESLFWQQVNVATGMMPADLNTPGLAITLTPRRPTMQWTTTAYGSGSGGSLASRTPGGPIPALVRLDGWTHGSVRTSGPVIADRLGLVAGGTWTRASKFERETLPTVESSVASGFASLVYTASPTSEWRTLGWVQRGRSPFEYRQQFQQAGAGTEDEATHVQSTWERRGPTGFNWRVLGGFTGRSRTNDIRGISALTAERLIDGPIPGIVSASGDTATRRWSLGARLSPARGRTAPRHRPEFGADIDRASLRTADQFSGLIGERIDSVRARVWAFSRPGADSRRQTTTVSAFASDRVVFSPVLTLDAAVRFESIRGSASGAANGVSWHTLLPSASLRWKRAEDSRVAFVGGYRRSANRLNLDVLAYGDPAAPTASVARWLGTPSVPTFPPSAVVIDRVGPGTGGDPGFSRIDPDLKRPYTDEFTVGIESQHRGWMRFALTGIARRESSLMAVSDVGVPIGSYSTIGIRDVGLDFFDDVDDQILPVYNRLPSSYGRNHYLLTNPSTQDAATAYALKLTLEGSTERLFVLFGATASAAEGMAGNRGYDPFENDQDALGELFTNPNATTYAKGRLFADRAYTIKWTMVYRFPGDIRLGGIARYQDGQPFARFVIGEGLSQGPEAVRAYPNGRNRFTFTGTFDLRAQKRFTIGTTRLDGILDVYNLFTRSNEVEEYVVTGAAFRTSTFIEPTPSVHLGVRVTF